MSENKVVSMAAEAGRLSSAETQENDAVAGQQMQPVNHTTYLRLYIQARWALLSIYHQSKDNMTGRSFPSRCQGYFRRRRSETAYPCGIFGSGSVALWQHSQ